MKRKILEFQFQFLKGKTQDNIFTLFQEEKVFRSKTYLFIQDSWTQLSWMNASISAIKVKEPVLTQLQFSVRWTEALNKSKNSTNTAKTAEVLNQPTQASGTRKTDS